jgi:hypothetical protein
VEAELDRRGGKSYGPPEGMHMTLFLDDVSMPEPNVWGDQPTLELARQLLETCTLCFLSSDKRGEMKTVEDLQVRVGNTALLCQLPPVGTNVYATLATLVCAVRCGYGVAQRW